VEYLFMGDGYGAGLRRCWMLSGRACGFLYTGHGGEDVKY
jgi:hypothetical protein